MDTGLPIFMGEAPEYRVKGGNMHINWPSLEIVLPVPVMLACIAGAEEALAKWKLSTLGKGDVIRLKRKRK